MQTQHANQCKQVQKPEVPEAILQLKRENPRITNKQLALQLKCHRNTISKYVNYIRQNYIKTPQEIVNRIDNRLEEEINVMHVRDLISYRNSLHPTEIKVDQTLTQTKTVTYNLNYSEEDKIAILNAYGRINKNSSGANQSQSLH